MYRWPTRLDFEQDLLVWLAMRIRGTSVGRMEHALSGAIDLAGDGASFAEIVDEMARGTVEAAVNSEEFPLLLAVYWLRIRDGLSKEAFAGAIIALINSFTMRLSVAQDCEGASRGVGGQVREIEGLIAAHTEQM